MELRKYMRSLVQRTGYDFHRLYLEPVRPVEFNDKDEAIWKLVEPYTLTGLTRCFALMKATRYVLDHSIPGSLVECGVWRGGSSMLMAATLLSEGSKNRELWLYDTFTGMSTANDFDVDYLGLAAKDQMLEQQRSVNEINVWCYSPLDEVKNNMSLTGYPEYQLKYVVGDVCDTLLTEIPESISLLRLDTDFYESTRAELEVLYPRLSKGGVIILDDYGHWNGARLAVDEFLESNSLRPLIHNVDFSCRMFIKD